MNSAPHGRPRSRDSATLTVWVSPGASREGIRGWMGDALKVAVSAPPEKGKANQAVARLIARQLGLPASAVAIVSGATSRRKVLRLHGVSAEGIERWLAQKDLRTTRNG